MTYSVSVHSCQLCLAEHHFLVDLLTPLMLMQLKHLYGLVEALFTKGEERLMFYPLKIQCYWVDFR